MTPELWLKWGTEGILLFVLFIVLVGGLKLFNRLLDKLDRNTEATQALAARICDLLKGERP